MSDVHSAPAVDAATADDFNDGEPVHSWNIEGDQPFQSASEAARALADARWKATQKPVEDESPPAQPDSGDEPDAVPPVAETNGTEEPKQAEPADDLPPIEPPRSWTKEEQEGFRNLPRETQEVLSRREQERDAAVRRGQNEAAEQRKAYQAELAKAEQARKEYESKLPSLLQTLEAVQAGQFADIKTVDDAMRLSQEDPFRYLQWQAHQDKIRAVAYEAEQIKQREAAERSKSWNSYVQEQNAKIAELHPELSDPAKADPLQKAAVQLLSDKGFTTDELNRLASGEEKLSIWDHRIQSLLIDGVKYQQAQKAPIKAVPKPVPPVVRPSAAAPKQSGGAAEIQALERQLDKATGLEALRLATRITQLKRAG